MLNSLIVAKKSHFQQLRVPKNKNEFFETDCSLSVKKRVEKVDVLYPYISFVWKE